MQLLQKSVFDNIFSSYAMSILIIIFSDYALMLFPI